MKMQKLKNKIWGWPDGIVWRVTERLTARSREQKYQMFLDLMKPLLGDQIVDVGAGGGKDRARNFLEVKYIYPENITAVGIDEQELKEMKKVFPKVRVVHADGRELPFSDQAFDIVFSNAAIEHVGSREKQAQFVKECLRVGKKLFITTPAYEFPVDSHTLIPFVHWLPLKLRNGFYKLLGRGYWASENSLNLLSARAFKKLFPKDSGIKIIKQRILGMPAVLIAIKV